MTSLQGGRGASSTGRLLDIIRSAGPISRVEIAERINLTPAAVSFIVRSLLTKGLVEEVGHVASAGGKPRTLLEITADARFGVGVHLGAEETTYVVSNMAGGVIGRQCRSRPAGLSPSATVDVVDHDLNRLLSILGVDRAGVVGVGIVASGPIDYGAGRIFGSPSFGDWSSFPLRDELSLKMDLPVLVDKDATAAAIGEFWGGRVDAPLSFACLYMEQGIGSGIVVDGSAFRGSASNAGEIGHVSLDVHGEPCRCGNRGCLELFAAPKEVVRMAHQRGMDFGGISSDSEARLFDEISRRAVNQDPLALEIMRISAEYVAEGVLTLVNITDLDLIILAGPGFAVASAIYIQAIRAALENRFFARSAHGIDVRFSKNPRDAAALGASALVLQQVLAPR